MKFFFTLVMAFPLVLLPVSCDSKKKKDPPPAPTEESESEEKMEDDTSPVEDETDSNADAEEEKTEPESKTSTCLTDGFHLADPSYEDISSIISTHCVSCHSAAGQDQQPYLETEDQVVAVAEKIATSVDLNADDALLMPPSTQDPLSDDDKSKLVAWAAALKNSSSETNSSQCPTETDSEFLESLFELSADCHDQGKLYDRQTTECSSYSLADYECTWENLKTAMATVADIANVLDGFKDDGWVIDQCGVQENGKPVAMLLRITDENNYEIREIAVSANE